MYPELSNNLNFGLPYFSIGIAALSIVFIVILVWLVIKLRRSNQKLISEKRSLELEKFRAEEEKNKTLFIISSFSDPVIMVDSTWKIILLNPAAKKIFQLSDNDLGRKLDVKQGKFIFDVFRGVTPVNFRVRELEQDYQGLPYVEEVVVGSDFNKKENLSEVALTGRPTDELIYKVHTAQVCDEEKVCYGHVKVFYDLTREKMVDRMKSDFISIVAHQLRTPLSAIKWAIGIVMNQDAGPITEEQKEFLNKGFASNERMISLVNDMLNVSRIEEGRFGYVFSRCDFKDIMNIVVENTTGMLASKHIKLQVQKESELPNLFIDKEKIALVLQNLLDNAIKYTPDNGEVSIILKVEGNLLSVCVKDKGIGIPKADQSRLFSKFFRSSNVVKMQTEGSGLGLFIVKNIIEKHGGKIWIESEEGAGTEVKFTLPIK